LGAYWLLVLLLLLFETITTKTDVLLSIIGEGCWLFICSFLLLDSNSMVATQWRSQEIWLQSGAAGTNLLQKLLELQRVFKAHLIV